MDEKERIKSILKGDTSAFTYFVETYQDMAITIAYRISNNMQDAEDITQDAFVKAFHNLHTFRTDSKFSTWFFRIVYNTAITHTRSSFYTSEYADYNEVSGQTNDFDIMDKIDANEREQIITKALEKIPKDSALILTLFYLNESPIKEVVQITGLSESNVKVKLHRARKQLYEVLKPMAEKEYI